MDKDKLNEAAWDYHSDNYFADNPHREDIMDAFKDGANWLMTQPLSDRLTDVEKAKARAAYKRAEECYNDNADDMSYAAGLVVKTVLKEIFGKELFNQPTEV